MRWFRTVMTLELRRLTSYRADFWTLFIGGTIAQMVIAFFLWKAVFAARGVLSLNGFDLDTLIFYYLLVALTDKLVRGVESSFVSHDIYDGSLNRYLMYPISFFGYRYAILLGGLIFSSAQAAIGVGLFFLVIGVPAGLNPSVAGVACAFALVVASGGVYFFLTLVIELFAFWADNVWSLLALLRFVVHLLGGGMVPLEFFPLWTRKLLFWTPFPHMLSTPIALFSGRVPASAAAPAVGIMIVWGLVFWGAALLVWRRGQKEYTGVGI